MERTYQLETAQLAAPIETEAGILLTVKQRKEADISGLNPSDLVLSLLINKKELIGSPHGKQVSAEVAIEIFEEDPSRKADASTPYCSSSSDSRFLNWCYSLRFTAF